MSKMLWSASALVVLCALSSGCANRPKPLYDWQGYQGNVDAYLRADKASLDEQVQRAEQDLQKIKMAGGVVPPGYNAHLGLLYAKQGKIDRFSLQVQAEQAQFPESQTFMDFLKRNLKK